MKDRIVDLMDREADEGLRPIETSRTSGVPPQPIVCLWTLDGGENGDLWKSGCSGRLFEFYEGGPKANFFEFCQYCGRVLKEAPVVNEDDVPW